MRRAGSGVRTGPGLLLLAGPWVSSCMACGSAPGAEPLTPRVSVEESSGGDAWAQAMAPRAEPEYGLVSERSSCFPQSFEVCRNALDDNCNGVVDEGCGLPSGIVQFILAWDEPTADVDLDVIDPAGELIEAGRVSAGGLFKEADCPQREGPCPGGNLENVFLEGDRAPQKGVYRVRVRLEAEQSVMIRVPARLSIRLAQELHTYDVSLSGQHPEVSLSIPLR